MTQKQLLKCHTLYLQNREVCMFSCEIEICHILSVDKSRTTVPISVQVTRVRTEERMAH